MPQVQKPLLSIVIVSYNVKDFLLECLGSIQQFVSVPHEVIVFDNASADGTCSAVKQLFPEVILVENRLNIGFSAGNNHCFALAKGELILMLNPDAAFVDGSLSPALAFVMGQAGKHVLAGPRLINTDKTYQPSAWKFPGVGQLFLESIFLNKLFDLSSYPELENAQTEKEIDYVSGATILMSRETLQSLTGLDENLFWMDDTDLCFRNKLNGGNAVYFPQWKVMHHIGKSSKKNLALVISNQLISKLKFFKKHGMWGKKIFAYFIFGLHILLRIILLLPLVPFSASIRRKWLAYLIANLNLNAYFFSGKHPVT